MKFYKIFYTSLTFFILNKNYIKFYKYICIIYIIINFHMKYRKKSLILNNYYYNMSTITFQRKVNIKRFFLIYIFIDRLYNIDYK